MTGKVKDITGQKFNKLTAIRCIGTKKTGDGRSEAIWEWQCDCGNKITAQARHVKYKDHRNAKQSCGCWHKTKKNFGPQAIAYRVYLHYIEDGSNLTFEQFLDLCQKPCVYCGDAPYNTMSSPNRARVKHSFTYNGLDRIDNSKGHDYENCVPACWRCNEMKKSKHQDDFLELIETIMLQQIKNEIEAIYGTQANKSHSSVER